MESRIYPINYIETYKYTVILAKYKGKWVFCKQKTKDTWETAGGHIEAGETPLEGAKRELHEETGATVFTIRPIFDYWAGDAEDNASGVIFYAEIEEVEELPTDFEMEKIGFFDKLPEKLSYPWLTPALIEHYNELFDGEKPQFLWHASPHLLTEIKPQAATGKPEENGDYEAIYAYETMQQVIPFAFRIEPAPDGTCHMYVDDITGEMWISKGYLDIDTAEGYVYKLPAEGFRRLDEIQWIAEKTIKPIEKIKVRAVDYKERIYFEGTRAPIKFP